MRIIFMQATWFTIPVLRPPASADLPCISIDVASRKVRSKSGCGGTESGQSIDTLINVED